MNAIPTAPHDLPVLAPPGAGLPWVELQVARLLFRWHVWQSTPASASALIETERREILSLTQSCSDDEAGRRVLIARLRGLEDSSRYWSVRMTLDHLDIVNRAVAQAIVALGRGTVPPQAASTAAVKPRPEPPEDVAERFSASCAAVDAAWRGVRQPESTPKYPHPWFGPLQAAEWHAMAGFHLRLHRRQIQAILHAIRRPVP